MAYSSSFRNEVLDESSSSKIIESSSFSSSSAEQIISSSSETITSSESVSPYLWSDEFEGSTIDTDKWTFEIGTGESGWGNNEWQYYTDRSENAYIKDGVLHIRANKESYEGASYTSARMITKGKFSFTYGTVEAIATGGRYDGLLAHFGKDAPSIGIMIQIDALLEALQRQKIEIPVDMHMEKIEYRPETYDACLKKAISLRKEGIRTLLVPARE